MNYEKAINKLEKFNELSKEKQMKLLKKILTDAEIVKWQFDPNIDRDAYSGEMFSRMYTRMALPAALRTYEPMLEHYGKETFSRTSIVILNTILMYAVSIGNGMRQSYNTELNSSGANAETKDMRNRIAKYEEHMDSLKRVIDKLLKPYLKTLASETNLDKSMLQKALLVAPEVKYSPQNRLTSSAIQLLEELYSEANAGHFPENGASVHWRPLFKTVFGRENIPSVAVSILLEGAHHIDKYRGSSNILLVRDCWDSLTKYALDELEHCPDTLRNQMLELYLKKAENLIARRCGRPTDLRVNLTRLPKEFKNTIRSVELYRSQFASINDKVRYATGKRNRETQNNQKDPVKTDSSTTKNALDTVIDTAHKVVDVLDSISE